MRKVALFLAFVSPGAGACTTFAFSAPSGASVDASVEVGAEAGSDAPASTTFLSSTQAGAVCSLLFKCPGLAEAIEGALAIPVNTPSSTLDFSGCMDWLSGPIDPARPGLATQRGILAQIATATTCSGAYGGGALPVQPTGEACDASACADGGILECAAGAGFTAACAPPIFGAAGQCETLQAPTCVIAGDCLGVSCSGSDLVDCIGVGKGHASYDCSLTGRACSKTGIGASCVGSVTGSPPCPLGKAPEDLCSGSGPTSSVEQCVSDAVQSEFGCGPIGLGWTCSTASGVARCVAPGAACGALDGNQNECVGSGITVCVGGKQQTFDCGSLGLGCVPEPPAAALSGHCG